MNNTNKHKNLDHRSSKTTNFNLKRLLYLMAQSQIVSTKSRNDDSWQRSLCYSNKNFNTLPRDTLLLYRRMAGTFESHWTRILTLTIYQGIERNVSYMITPLSSHSEIRLPQSQNPILYIYICCGGKDMVALDWLPFIAKFFKSHPKESNTAFLLVEYPGYGFNMGTATPSSCRDAVLQTLKKALEIYPNRRIIARFLGYSLGAAVLLDSANVIYDHIYSGDTRLSFNSSMKKSLFTKYNSSPFNRLRNQRYLSRLCKIKTRIPQPLQGRKIMPFSRVRGRCQPRTKTDLAGVFVRIKRKLRYHRARVTITTRRWFRKSPGSSDTCQWLKRIKLQHMILISPFTSTVECFVAYLKIPSFLRPLSTHFFSIFQNESTKFNNTSIVKRLFENLSKHKHKFNLIVFHGDKDRLVPCYMGQKIIDDASLWPNVHKCNDENCSSEPIHAKMCIIPGADHTTICSDTEYLNRIFDAMCIDTDPNELYE